MKPSDFFLNVLSFFAILVPGAILAFLWRDLPKSFQFPSLAVQDWPTGLAFFAVAYLLGQALFSLGSWFLDPVYSRTYIFYKRWKKEVEGDPLLKLQIKVPIDETSHKKITGTYPWARAYVGGRSQNAAGYVAGLDADSKFFRSLVIVLAAAPYGLIQKPFSLSRTTIVTIGSGFVLGLVVYVLTLYLEGQIKDGVHRWTLSGHHLFKWAGIGPTGFFVAVTAGAASMIAQSKFSWPGLLAYLLVVIGFFARFANQRWERDDTAYEFVLTLPPSTRES